MTCDTSGSPQQQPMIARKRPTPFVIKKELEEYANKKLFRRAWLKMDIFKDWLMEGICADLAYCKICEKNICAGKSELMHHLQTKKHIKLSKENSTTLRKLYSSNLNSNLERIIDMRSDSFSQPCITMKKIMVDSLSGDAASMNKDVEEFEEFVSQLLDKDMGLLFPSHSMANLVAVLAYCQARGSAAMFGNQSALFNCHRKALIEFGGLHCISFVNNTDGSFCLDSFERTIQSLNLELPLTAFVSYEATFFRGGGKVLNLDWIRQLGLLCLSYGVHLHCDGARLINASLHLGVPMSDLVTFCDSVTLALDKSLGSSAGAILVGDEHFIKRARFVRDVLGGHMHQGAFLAAGAKCALERFIPRVESDHTNAKGIALAIVKENSPLIWVDYKSVETNIVHIFTDGINVTAQSLVDRLELTTHSEIEDLSELVIVKCGVVDENTAFMVTHNNLADHDVRMAIRKIIYVINEYRQVGKKCSRKRV